MPDEPREPQDAPEEPAGYQSPEAEELPEVDPLGVGGGPAVGTNQDNTTASDRRRKRDFAAVDADAALRVVLDLPIRSS